MVRGAHSVRWLPETSQGALGVLEMFSSSAKISFDRLLAGRVLSEAERSIPGDDCGAWCRRLVEVGESLNLRVRSLECPVADVLTLVKQGIPVVACVRDPQDRSIAWITLAEMRGHKVRVQGAGGARTTEELPSEWVKVSNLPETLGLSSHDVQIRWVVAQAAMGCESASKRGERDGPGKSSTPWARLLALLRPEKKDLWTLLIFAVVVGFLALASPVAVEALVNTVAFGRYLQPVVVLALMLFVFLAFAAAIRALLTYVAEIVQRRLFVRVVEDLAYRLPRVRQDALDGKYGPELVNRFFDIVTVQKVVSALLLDGLALVLQMVIGMTVLAFYHPFLLGFDAALLLIMLIVLWLGRGAVNTAIVESKKKYRLAAWLQELARQPTAFKMHAGGQYALEHADQLAVDWLEARRKHFRIVMRQVVFNLGAQALAGTAVLGLGGWLVILGELTLGQLVASELIVMVIVGSFTKLNKHIESTYDLLASVDKLGVLFDLPVEEHDKLFHLRDAVPADLSVLGVSYKYNGRAALSNVNFSLAPGEATALVGDAGSGKSTLIDIITGARQPEAGHVELDGFDLRQLRPDSLREHLALSRDVEVFEGTIDENVHLNRSHISADDVREALDRVGLLDEVLRLPDGLNTMLQTGGAPLSSSQARRLMVARAIVGRPRLLLIDGTLDGLPDRCLEQTLQRLIEKDMPWTLLIATGRRQVMDRCRDLVSLSPEPQEELEELAGHPR